MTTPERRSTAESTRLEMTEMEPDRATATALAISNSWQGGDKQGHCHRLGNQQQLMGEGGGGQNKATATALATSNTCQGNTICSFKSPSLLKSGPQ